MKNARQRHVSRRTALSAGLVVASGLVASACSSRSSGAPGHDDDGAAMAITHIHGITRDPRTGKVVIATHQGLYGLEQDGWTGGGPVLDLMGFAIAPDGSYLGSGHPGPALNLPQPAGLVRSTDQGRTWTVLSRGGESDFHALAAGPDFVIGFDGTLRLTEDQTTWSDLAIPAAPHSLAASPTSGVVLAATEQGLLASGDRGATWKPLTPPALLGLVAWADDNTIVGAGVDRRLHLSRDAGQSWTAGTKEVGEVTALGASTSDGKAEALFVVGTDVLRSTDGGATTERLG
ncbi:MAG: hypothetical protein L0H79_18605 [Intrasporangium sp.]|uniref:F510_1955 family glycosylhydrolase n=1 Tax=Intrasporangium sp. TaxID=1925024 RepID=UPI002649F97E|nr:hypothetical protein [Intrasporangium sp.]MDN5797739.1 hypothetical protein [Intrasporangium sp.]